MIALDGSLGVGEDSTIYQKHHTLVFSSSESENGVLLRNVSPSGLTRVVLIAGEPLDQEVVQYGPFVVTSQMKARQAIMDCESILIGGGNET
jgi:redox-sensitive bicupin YhaK (pirin superfamily)